MHNMCVSYVPRSVKLVLKSAVNIAMSIASAVLRHVPVVLRHAVV